MSNVCLMSTLEDLASTGFRDNGRNDVEPKYIFCQGRNDVVRITHVAEQSAEKIVAKDGVWRVKATYVPIADQQQTVTQYFDSNTICVSDPDWLLDD